MDFKSSRMKSIIIFYDNHCPNCTRFTKIIKKLDWLNLIIAKELRNSNYIGEFKNIDIEMSKGKMASCIDDKWYYGYKSIFLIFSKLPIFWIILPLLYILKITKFGELFYNELAIKRKIIPLNCEQSNCSINE
jgi:predicted DCC family thiol-disulfide oxidoreductase YuxK